MKNKNACVNSHEQTVSANSSTRSITDPTASSVTELGCSVTKVIKNGKPALLARVNLYAQTEAAETLSALLHHAEELNLRLPFLSISVKTETETLADAEKDIQTRYLFVLHGLSQRSITERNISNFLNRLTHDFRVFLAYAKAHNIQVQPSLGHSAVTPLDCNSVAEAI